MQEKFVIELIKNFTQFFDIHNLRFYRKKGIPYPTYGGELCMR